MVFLGLGASQESEGFDRDHIELPAEQLVLLDAVTAAQPRTVEDRRRQHDAATRCLAGESASRVPFDVDARAEQDVPGEHQHAVYGERIFVGYRGYDARRLEVTFPFGHGLSYTRFDYSDIHLGVGDAGIAGTTSLTGTVSIAGDTSRPPLTLDSTMGEVLADPVAGPLVIQRMGEMGGFGSDAASTGNGLGVDMARMTASIPLDRIVTLSGGQVSRADLEELLAQVNSHR